MTDTETAMVGLNLLDALRYSQEAFIRIVGSTDSELTGLVNQLGRDLGSLTMWTRRMRGDCRECEHYDAMGNPCWLEDPRALPDWVCIKLKRA